MKAQTVLVVEDEPLLLDLVAAEIEDAGFNVIRVTTAEQAVEILQGEAEVDHLFTDIRLPGSIDGWQLAERARQLRPEISVIYATGYSFEAPRPMPGSMFFTKPYRPAKILAAIHSLSAL